MNVLLKHLTLTECVSFSFNFCCWQYSRRYLTIVRHWFAKLHSMVWKYFTKRKKKNSVLLSMTVFIYIGSSITENMHALGWHVICVTLLKRIVGENLSKLWPSKVYADSEKPFDTLQKGSCISFFVFVIVFFYILYAICTYCLCFLAPVHMIPSHS